MLCIDYLPMNHCYLETEFYLKLLLFTKLQYYRVSAASARSNLGKAGDSVSQQEALYFSVKQQQNIH